MEDSDKLGYQTALQLAVYEGHLIWRAFQALLTANVFLVALSGAAIRYCPDFPFARWCFPIAGILVCLAWIMISSRQMTYYALRFTQARHFEDGIAGLDVVNDGSAFSRGLPVEIEVAGEVVTHRMGLCARLFNVKRLNFLIILVFLTVYCSLLAAGWPTLKGLLINLVIRLFLL